MASPHVCGLLAYFLSEYPKAFKPSHQDFVLAGEASPYEAPASTFRQSAQTVFQRLAHLAGFAAPTSKKHGEMPEVLSPKVLKNSLIRIATQDVLTVREQSVPTAATQI